MVDLGLERALRWFEWVVGRKEDFEFENAAFIGCFSGSNNGCFPIKEVVITWTC
jgi:hypothetical protein